MYHTLVLAVLIFVFSIAAPAQNIEPKPPQKSDDIKQLKTDAIDLLKETGADVNNLRSLPNRIGFSAELASLMWFYDERQAKLMLDRVISDYRDLLARYNADLNAASSTDGPGDSTDEVPDKALAERRLSTAVAVGQQITGGIAEHDPELAFDFYSDSLSAITNPEFRKQIETQNSWFETTLLIKISQTNPTKALPYAARSVASGFGSQHLELLRNLYAKEPDAAAAFAGAIVSSIKANKVDPNNFWTFSNLLEFGAQTFDASKKADGKRAVFTESQLRDLSDAFAEAVLTRNREEVMASIGYLVAIDRFSPGRGAQIRAKFGIKTPRYNMASRELPVVRGQDSAETDTPDVTMSPLTDPDVAGLVPVKIDKKTEEMTKDIEKLGSKELPTEERTRIVAQARKMVAEIPGRESKIGSLCYLAAQVRRAGDKELAASLLKDAASFVNPSPRNYQDFLRTWALATGYATADPDRAFDLLGDTVSRANDTIEAFVKVGEFMDVSGEMIDDGEVQVGALGGSRLIGGITGELGLADVTIQLLARADFAKLRELTNKFDRPEVRVLAKMLVVRAILGSKLKPSTDAITSLDSN